MTFSGVTFFAVYSLPGSLEKTSHRVCYLQRSTALSGVDEKPRPRGCAIYDAIRYARQREGKQHGGKCGKRRVQEIFAKI